MLALRQHLNSGDGGTVCGCYGNECAQRRHVSVSCHGLPWRPLPAHTCHACTYTPTRAVGGHFDHCRCTRQPLGHCNVHAVTCITFTPMHHPPIMRNLSTPTRLWLPQGAPRATCTFRTPRLNFFRPTLVTWLTNAVKQVPHPHPW